jgi:hypothetical protein
MYINKEFVLRDEILFSRPVSVYHTPMNNFTLGLKQCSIEIFIVYLMPWYYLSQLTV